MEVAQSSNANQSWVVAIARALMIKASRRQGQSLGARAAARARGFMNVKHMNYEMEQARKRLMEQLGITKENNTVTKTVDNTPPVVEVLAKAFRSKYMPHYGSKQRAKDLQRCDLVVA